MQADDLRGAENSLVGGGGTGRDGYTWTPVTTVGPTPSQRLWGYANIYLGMSPPGGGRSWGTYTLIPINGWRGGGGGWEGVNSSAHLARHSPREADTGCWSLKMVVATGRGQGAST